MEKQTNNRSVAENENERCDPKWDPDIKESRAQVTGKDALEAFDYVDVANKGAKLFLMCLSSGFVPEGVSAKDMQELKETFGL